MSTTLLRFADETGRATADLRFEPILVLSFEGAPSSDIVTKVFTAYGDFLAQRGQHERFVTIIDSSAIDSVTASTRRAAAQELSRLRTQLQRQVLKHYAVFASPFVRGAVTAVNWLTGPTLTGLDSFTAAWNLACADLEAAGVKAPTTTEASYKASLLR